MWFGICFIMYKLLNTFNIQPYDAWAPEITDDADRKNTLFFTCTMFDGVGSLFAAVLPVGVSRFVNTFYEPIYTSCMEFEGEGVPGGGLQGALQNGYGTVTTRGCYHISEAFADVEKLKKMFTVDTATELINGTIMPILSEDYCTTDLAEEGLCKCFAACRLASDTVRVMSDAREVACRLDRLPSVSRTEICTIGAAASLRTTSAALTASSARYSAPGSS